MLMQVSRIEAGQHQHYSKYKIAAITIEFRSKFLSAEFDTRYESNQLKLLI